VYPKVSGLSHNEINNNSDNNKHLFRSNTKSNEGKTHHTDSQNSDIPGCSGREVYHLQSSLQAVSPETSGYTIVLRNFSNLLGLLSGSFFCLPPVLQGAGWWIRSLCLALGFHFLIFHISPRFSFTFYAINHSDKPSRSGSSCGSLVISLFISVLLTYPNQMKSLQFWLL